MRKIKGFIVLFEATQYEKIKLDSKRYQNYGSPLTVELWKDKEDLRECAGRVKIVEATLIIKETKKHLK